MTRLAFFTIAATLAASTAFAASGKLEYRVTAKTSEATEFACVKSSSGTCVLTLGLPAETQTERLEVEQGSQVSVPNPQGQRQYCVTISQSADWPKCLSDNRTAGLLSKSTSSSQVWWDK
jgi:hypothetical protein